MRVRIFVDFWNFQIHWNTYHRRSGRTGVVRIPWKDVLPSVICDAIDSRAVYAGTNVYASVDPKNKEDSKLRGFLNAMDAFPGYKVTIKQRKQAARVRCPKCESHVDHCPSCNARLIRSVEKGVDTSLVTDLLTMGIGGIYDRAVLVSADSDMVSAVEFLQQKGCNVTHFFFRPYGNELRNACWNNFGFEDYMQQLAP